MAYFYHSRSRAVYGALKIMIVSIDRIDQQRKHLDLIYKECSSRNYDTHMAIILDENPHLHNHRSSKSARQTRKQNDKI
jgi:hypothetical protein